LNYNYPVAFNNKNNQYKEIWWNLLSFNYWVHVNNTIKLTALYKNLSIV